MLKKIIIGLSALALMGIGLACSNPPTLTETEVRQIVEEYVLTGPQGISGPQGIRGDPGPQGLEGLPGATGVPGELGPRGNQGAKGFAGPRGLQGAQGEAGPPGAPGTTSISVPTRPPRPTAKLTTTATLRPTTRATPAPLLPEGNGNWIYFGPECPDGFGNCALLPSDKVSLLLEAYYNANESFHDEPDILVSCFRGNSYFTFDGGGPWIALGEARMNIRFASQGPEEGTHYSTDRGSEDLGSIVFGSRDTNAILKFIQDADQQGKDVRMVVSGDHHAVVAAVVADFDVTGFTTNFQRLPCS